jgi:hypothetical protein
MARSLPTEPYSNLVTLYPHSRPHLLDGLARLMIEERMEFVALDALPPFDDNGNIAWTFEGEPTSEREKRWLELYQKHEQMRERCNLLFDCVPTADAAVGSIVFRVIFGRSGVSRSFPF